MAKSKSAPKEVVSFAIDPALEAAIAADISALEEEGVEMTFSLWMRDAARLKLRRKIMVAEEPPIYGKKTAPRVMTARKKGKRSATA